jgi:hypothetical protein
MIPGKIPESAASDEEVRDVPEEGGVGVGQRCECRRQGIGHKLSHNDKGLCPGPEGGDQRLRGRLPEYGAAPRTTRCNDDGTGFRRVTGYIRR